MTIKEQLELDAWIAELMEPKPFSQTLRAVRGKNDDRYNSASQTSKFGWWECQTGTDAENRHIGDLTLCEWEPNHRPASSPDEMESKAAAMEVLKKCIERLENDRAYPALQKYYDLDGFNGWKVDALYETKNQRTFGEVAETLELAICLFAKKLFSNA